MHGLSIKGIGIRNQFYIPSVHLLTTLITGAAGYIIIGVEEERMACRSFRSAGLPDSIDRINKELLQKCNLIEPQYVPIVEQTIYEGADILVLWVPGGESRPYKCPTSFPAEKAVRSDKAYYIRKLSNTIKANNLEEKELFFWPIMFLLMIALILKRM